jgi:hypothetical protein
VDHAIDPDAQRIAFSRIREFGDDKRRTRLDQRVVRVSLFSIRTVQREEEKGTDEGEWEGGGGRIKTKEERRGGGEGGATFCEWISDACDFF